MPHFEGRRRKKPVCWLGPVCASLFLLFSFFRQNPWGCQVSGVDDQPGSGTHLRQEIGGGRGKIRAAALALLVKPLVAVRSSFHARFSAHFTLICCKAGNPAKLETPTFPPRPPSPSDQEIVRQAMVRAELVSELNSQRLEQKAPTRQLCRSRFGSGSVSAKKWLRCGGAVVQNCLWAKSGNPGTQG